MADRYLRNDPDRFLTEAIDGFVAAHPGIVWHRDPGFLARRDALPAGRVALVSGGGSGHEPMHAGMIGDGMLAAACPGLVFTSPNALQIAAAARRVDTGGGVLFVVKNYTGDVMNFSTAGMLLGSTSTDTVLVDDDVATESADAGGPGRRGTGATVVVEKVCGAAAARGDDLSALTRLGRRVVVGSRSMSVATAACTVPGADRPSFELADGEIEIGIGIHGEPGIGRESRRPASAVVADLVDRIDAALGLASGDRVIVLVNGLGAAHPLELNLVYGEVARRLGERGVRIERALVGTLVTALDMKGVSVTVTRTDDEITALWDAPTDAPGWPRTTPEPPLPVDDVSTAGTFAEPDDAAGAGEPNEWLTAFVARVLGSIDELTALDRAAGDGDFGTNLRAALGHHRLPLRGGDAVVLDALSRSFLVRSGGTSGAVFGLLFGRLAAAAAEDEDRTSWLRAGARSGLTGVVGLGGARVGDSTVVDALAPAVETLEAGADLAAVAAAARAGAESTRDTVARRGRASYVGERSRGVVDPGALVTSWLFEAAASH